MFGRRREQPDPAVEIMYDSGAIPENIGSVFPIGEHPRLDTLRRASDLMRAADRGDDEEVGSIIRDALESNGDEF